ncbi:DUF2267 domain-containing protein [Hyphomicrobium sp.]|uniref:DUF2267 domain-containing protein n=1 Tax=Hyphomicrobium sp. TaxID=82 RepID=UPI0025B99337|nr:DUF2267 domain-containing protein [Hyphomicrobium sp.]MCC7252464.1 DUF2267 domain-containing protein [Hyphomicrobium sp.]
MTIPMEYRTAAKDFEQFLDDALEASGLATRNQVYTMVQGVFQMFRSRLGVGDAIRFANALPPLLRALFIDDWHVEQPQRPFDDRAAMTREAQALRRDHNFAPDSAIRDVAIALRRNVDEPAFDRVLSTLPDGAEEFWRVQV